MNILLLDNYDSFTYNLKHQVEEIIQCPITVLKNDQIDLDQIAAYNKIIFSPGPGIPNEAGQMKQIIQQYYKSIPMLGVCLGEQAIGEVFGANLLNLAKVFHGVATKVKPTKPEDPLFHKIPSPFEAGRYHSWVVDTKGFPNSVLEILATDEEGMIMALKHKQYNVYGVQFHPESILTPMGSILMRNWLMIK